MKLSSLSVKRRPVKKGAFRTLFANVARKKHRAATAAAPMPEMESDVPNLGIARALVVILVIHVVAIAGIFAHSHWFESDAPKTAVVEKELLEPAKPLPDSKAALPQVGSDADSVHFVKAGDTYEKIAVAHGVEVTDLRAENDNMELRANRILRIPARTIVAAEPEELTRLRNGSAVLENPAEIAVETLPLDELRSAPMVETEAAAVLVRPGVTRSAGASRPVEQAGPAASGAATKKYTVKNGDTFWKIAKTNGTTPEAVMKANRISDPRKLRPGMQLVVP
jgi:LysM repeat protein